MSNRNRAGSSWLLHEVLADQAVANPDRPAVVLGGSVLTYRTLLENAYSIAVQLRALGVRQESAVASLLPRGLALAPAVLGTWLAGGGVVPMDPKGPPQRREYMLRDCKPAAVVATAETATALREGTAPVVIVDAFGSTSIRPEQAADFEASPAGSADLAYIIYTSGSTGRPKGVLVDHGNLMAMACSHELALYGGQGRNVQHVALNNVTIADSFFSDFAHLAFGRTLHVVDEATRRDPDRLAQFISDHGIEVLDGTPTQIQTLVLAGRISSLASLTVLVLGGEATKLDLWQRLSGLPGVQPYNLYGPTECTVAVTAAAFRDHPSPMLGSPLPGCSVWVVDDALRQVGDGKAGELLITGDQVARGYLNPAAADAARFVSFELPDGGRTVRGYRTGDRGRRDRAGHLEFLGRTDSQVSIAGYRVELGEVEAVMRDCPGVRAAEVGARQVEHETTLVAYAVLDPQTSIEKVRDKLTAALPRHMVPSITAVSEIPMGPTGKTDIALLMQTAGAGQRNSLEMAAPDSAISSDVAETVKLIWCEMLGISTVGPSDDFFALGGDSLTATQVIVAIRGAVASGMPIRMLFDHPNFYEFCQAVGSYRQRVAIAGDEQG
jgi:amino acid adenylation domain-containing protein